MQNPSTYAQQALVKVEVGSQPTRPSLEAHLPLFLQPVTA